MASVLRPVSERVDPAADRDATCPMGVCDGSGWILEEEEDVARPCDCRERRISRNASVRLSSAIPKRFRGVSFDRKPVCDLDPMVLRHVRDYVQHVDERLDDGVGLWFHGDVGTGKTSISMLVAKAADQAGRSIAVYSVPQLLATIRRTYETGAEDSYDALMRRLTGVDLLVLDDLGAERQTEWVLEQLYMLVNERWQNRGAVLVTTNVPDPDPEAPTRILQHEVAELRRQRERGAAPERLGEVVERLERAVERLAQVDLLSERDPLLRLRHQVGSRTVSRLIEMCDDPIPIMGPDLRVTASLG
jgi:DNA replication protein DnaC